MVSDDFGSLFDAFRWFSMFSVHVRSFLKADVGLGDACINRTRLAAPVASNSAMETAQRPILRHPSRRLMGVLIRGFVAGGLGVYLSCAFLVAAGVGDVAGAYCGGPR